MVNYISLDLYFVDHLNVSEIGVVSSIFVYSTKKVAKFGRMYSRSDYLFLMVTNLPDCDQLFHVTR